MKWYKYNILTASIMIGESTKFLIQFGPPFTSSAKFQSVQPVTQCCRVCIKVKINNMRDCHGTVDQILPSQCLVT